MDIPQGHLKNSRRLKRLEFSSFPYVLNKTIIIPEDIFIFRGYHKDTNPVSEVPTYYSSLEVAGFYSEKPDHKLGFYKTTKQLRLLDIRYIIMLFKEMFNYPTKNYDLDFLEQMTLSLGLCSLDCQMKLLKKYINNIRPDLYDKFQQKYNRLDVDKMIGYVNPVEFQGVRLGITEIDRYMIAHLKAMFYDKYEIDGFIAPRTFSIFLNEDNFLYEEIVLFNPFKSGIVQIGFNDNNKNKLQDLPIIKIMDLLDITITCGFPITSRIFTEGYSENIKCGAHSYFNNYFRVSTEERTKMDNWLCKSRIIADDMDNSLIVRNQTKRTRPIIEMPVDNFPVDDIPSGPLSGVSSKTALTLCCYGESMKR